MNESIPAAPALPAATIARGGARIVAAVALGAVVFLACWVGMRFFAEAQEFGALARQWLFKPALIVISLAIWAAARRPFREMGFRRSHAPISGIRLRRWYVLSALGMGAASIVMILIGARHPILAELSFPQIIVTVWFLSSVAEEIFVRGLVQSWMRAPGAPADVGRAGVIASAVLFAAMHVPLMFTGSGVVGGGTIVAATLVVGYAAARARNETGSLLHPIGVHVFGNAMALPFGVIGMLLYKSIHGVLPPH